MTRKRFWGLRNALNVRLNEWSKEANGCCPSGITDKDLRPKSGKPLVDFEKGKRLGISSYDDCWNSAGMIEMRKSLGMG